jgi:hypothetical protein
MHVNRRDAAFEASDTLMDIMRSSFVNAKIRGAEVCHNVRLCPTDAKTGNGSIVFPFLKETSQK